MDISNNLKLTKEQISKIELDFSLSPAVKKKQGLLSVIEGCSEDEKVLLKFIYAYMPASDISSYNPEIFVKHVRQMNEIRNAVPWSQKLSDEMFINYILPLRINNEDLTEYRELFFNELYPKVKKLSMAEAVLEINYWCFEKATYKSTDIRTLSPLSILRNAYGRCGEESVLCVAALRSLGIPARQCYTPRWAHCDDNHAWVEVWVDGKWHFIGACEPEAVLDKGWFAETAIRGMLIHSRLFSGIVSNEDITLETPIMKQINVLDNYTMTKILNVYVVDDSGKPLEFVDVRFELINFAQFYPLVSLKTDINGIASLKTGYGDLNIHISYDGKFMYKKAESSCCEVRFCFGDAKVEDSFDYTYDQKPPIAKDVVSQFISEDMQNKHEEKIKKAIETRKSYEETFINGDGATNYASKFEKYQSEIASLISLSNGNHAEIRKFLENDTNLLKYKVMLLKCLRPKDLSDINFEILESHLHEAYKFCNDFDEEIFRKFILSPVVHFEVITDYRRFINNYFTKNQKEIFIKQPIDIYKFINNNIEDCGNSDYETLYSSPKGLLEIKYGSIISRKILFVAICRTIGIPARMSKIDQKIEYMKNNKWEIIDEFGNQSNDRTCTLILKSYDENTVLNYEKQFTIAHLQNGIYKTLGLVDIAFENGKVQYNLEEGQYRIITSNRLVDGSVLANVSHVKLVGGQTKEIILNIREQISNKNENIKIADIPVINQKGEKIIANKFAINNVSVIAFLEVKKEPTEHILNEIIEQSEKFKEYNKNILLVLESPKCLEDNLLSKALELTQIPVAFRTMDSLELNNLLGNLEMQNIKFPLVLGLDKLGDCEFHLFGYNVGTGDLLLNYFKTK